MSVLSSTSSEVLVVLHLFDEDDLKNDGFLSAEFSLHCVVSLSSTPEDEDSLCS